MIHSYLRRHAAKTSEAYYYQIREQHNASGVSKAQAARFIYLNKTCFNGIFRVNRKGEYNVPYGHKEPPALPGLALLRGARDALKQASLSAVPFEIAIGEADQDDFVYLDPPYPPLNGTSYFTHYTPDRFGERDQRRLAWVVSALHERGAKFLMTNADTPLIRQLYGRFNLFVLSVTRYITCKEKKHLVSELVITNYRPVARGKIT